MSPEKQCRAEIGRWVSMPSVDDEIKVEGIIAKHLKHAIEQEGEG